MNNHSMKEVDPSESAISEGGITIEDYYGQTVWNGEKLVTPQEWEAQQK